MFPRITSIFLSLALLLVSFGCQVPFDFSINSSGNLLVIEGIITDSSDPQIVTIKRTNLGKYKSSSIETVISFDSTANVPITKANVKLLVNGTQTFNFSEVDDGIYQLPDAFHGKVGDSYQLSFQTSDGKQYQSSVETMMAVPPIKKTYDYFNPKGINNISAGTFTPSNDVFIDFDDPTAEKNYYQWKWTLWEYQNICATCQQGYYILYDLGNRTYGQCVQDTTLNIFNYFDYPCLDLTWDIFYSNQINISSDIFTNGQAQKGKLVAQIPLNQSNPCLVAIQQSSLTTGAYQYYKLLQDQSQNTGTLADSPPSPIVGNVKNINDSRENTFGYFSASAVAISRYFVDRHNTVGGKNNNLFFVQNRRDPNLPYGTIYPHSSATCVPSKSRTCSKPLGWL